MKERKPEKKPREVSIFREYFELIAETLIYVFFVMTFLLQSFVIPTGSMEDTLLVGDHLFVDKVAYSRSLGGIDRLFLPQTPIERGMIVTFKAPHEMDKEYVKRVIALPGETIQLIDKQVYIDGKPLEEPYTFYKGGGFSIDDFPTDQWHYYFPYPFRLQVVDTPQGKAFKVPENHYFCMGDNRDDSLDSRYWGPVPAQYIIGKPWRIFWSYQSTRHEYIDITPLDKMKDLAKTIINFIPKTRWNRTIRKVN